jgi:phage terminase small subunit
MPTPLKRTENMTKHLTKAEKQVRQAAEVSLRRKRVVVKAPAWLGENARKVFEATKKRMRGLDLLDNVDVDLLAVYCDAVVKYQTETDTKDKQAWSRIILSYAEKLGISQSARARLAKKKAEQIPPDDMELLLDEVRDYVNGDV